MRYQACGRRVVHTLVAGRLLLTSPVRVFLNESWRRHRLVEECGSGTGAVSLFAQGAAQSWLERRKRGAAIGRKKQVQENRRQNTRKGWGKGRGSGRPRETEKEKKSKSSAYLPGPRSELELRLRLGWRWAMATAMALAGSGC